MPELALEAELHERSVQLREINLPCHAHRRVEQLAQLGFGFDEGLPDVVLGEVERRGDGGCGAGAPRPAPAPCAAAASGHRSEAQEVGAGGSGAERRGGGSGGEGRGGGEAGLDGDEGHGRCGCGEQTLPGGPPPYLF